MKYLYALLLICCATVVDAQRNPFPTFGAKGQKLDSTRTKKLVNMTCHCFKDLPDFMNPFMAIEMSDEPYEVQQAKRDSMRKIGEEFGKRMFDCLQGEMKKNKEALGLQNLPDSLFEYTFNEKTPPPFLEHLNISASVIMYAIRDCPYMFKSMTKVLDAQQEATIRRMARMDSIQKAEMTINTDSVVTKTEEIYPPEPEPDYYEDAYTKQFKAVLKSVDSKGYPALLVEREDPDGKKRQDRLLLLYRLDNGDDIIKNIKQHKGKKVLIKTYKEEFFNPKTNQYDVYWRVMSIKFLGDIEPKTPKR